jgi:hypothetical protein
MPDGIAKSPSPSALAANRDRRRHRPTPLRPCGGRMDPLIVIICVNPQRCVQRERARCQAEPLCLCPLLAPIARSPHCRGSVWNRWDFCRARERCDKRTLVGVRCTLGRWLHAGQKAPSGPAKNSTTRATSSTVAMRSSVPSSISRPGSTDRVARKRSVRVSPGARTLTGGTVGPHLVGEAAREMSGSGLRCCVDRTIGAAF